MLWTKQLALAEPTVAMRQISYTIAFVLLLVALLIFAVGELLSQPAPQTIGTAPADISATSIRLPTAGNQSISGWFIKGNTKHGAVLLLHGIRGNRLNMLARARFLNKAGYPVLLVDLLAHGESTGKRITFGFHEADGINAALGYLAQQLPNEKIAVIGVSLGAASLVLANTPIQLSAVVLESMFPSITEAVINRLKLHMGASAGYFAPLLLWQLPFKIGISADQLRPIAAMPELHAPVLIASGSKDLHTTLAETQHLFQAANLPKQLWVVDGAAHEDLHAFNPKIYESKILAFLAKYIRKSD
jgi:pimeloyl-ACP methyl ester carboxylesterase